MIRLYAMVSGLTLERDGVFSSSPDFAAIDRISLEPVGTLVNTVATPHA